MNTIGISPKVAWPAAMLVLAGAALLVAGVLLNDGEVRTAGVAVLGAAGVQAPVGFRAPAATTRETVVASDDLLSDEAKAKLAESS